MGGFRKLYREYHYFCLIMAEPLSDEEACYWLKKGNEFNNSGRYQDAVDSFDKAIRINPGEAEIWNNRGIALANLKSFNDALKSFEEAGLINPMHSDAWYNKGMVQQYEILRRQLNCHYLHNLQDDKSPQIWPILNDELQRSPRMLLASGTSGGT